MKYRIKRQSSTPFDKVHEECGVFGIALKEGSTLSAAHSVYTALYTLQHRGQQTAGIASVDKGAFHLHKGPGLVPDVFGDKNLKTLTGPAAIGHVRYASGGDTATINAQPLVVTHASGSMAVCYNGRLVNSDELRRETENRGGIFQSSNSAEVIAYLLVRERMRAGTIEDAVINAMQYMVGAYSVVLLTQGKLVAFRDPNGFRPLCIGEVDGSIMFASESCAFPVLGGHLIREVEPGEVVVADLGAGTYRSVPSGIKARSSLCMFEFIYFSRADSVIDGASVDLVRLEAGRCLARRNTVEADCVIGVPDPLKMQKVKAFVMLKPGVPANEETKAVLMAYIRKNVAKYALPYDIEFRAELPKTLVGKVAYRVLEEEELKKLSETAQEQ